MGLFDFAFRSKGERALHKAALHVQKYWEGKKLTNDAISHRQLGNFSEAAQLLKKALLQYDYNPAATIIVGTLMMQDKPKEAEEFIRDFMDSPRGLEDTGTQIELLANLGSIYFRWYKKYDEAVEVYKKALSVAKPEDLSEEAYAFCRSGVHRDLTLLYFECLSVLPDKKESKQNNVFTFYSIAEDRKSTRLNSSHT